MDLPYEILSHILNYLPTENLLQIRLACRYLNNRILVILKGSLFISGYDSPKLLEDKVKFYSQYAKEMIALSLTSGLFKTFRCFPALEVLQVMSFKAPAFRNRLEEHFWPKSKKGEGCLFLSLLQCFPQLTSLDITFFKSGGAFSSSNFKNFFIGVKEHQGYRLKYLTLNKVQSSDYEIITELPDDIPTLVTFDISFDQPRISFSYHCQSRAFASFKNHSSLDAGRVLMFLSRVKELPESEPGHSHFKKFIPLRLMSELAPFIEFLGDLYRFDVLKIFSMPEFFEDVDPVFFRETNFVSLDSRDNEEFSFENGIFGATKVSLSIQGYDNNAILENLSKTFPRLQILYLSDKENRKLYFSQRRDIVFPQLTHLMLCYPKTLAFLRPFIKHCPRLSHILMRESPERIRQLQKKFPDLTIGFCPEEV